MCVHQIQVRGCAVQQRLGICSTTDGAKLWMTGCSIRYRSSASFKIHLLLFIRINYPKQSTDLFSLVLEQARISVWQPFLAFHSWTCFFWIRSCGAQKAFLVVPLTTGEQQPRSSQGDHRPSSTAMLLLLASSWAWLWWAQARWQCNSASATRLLGDTATALWRCLKLAQKNLCSALHTGNQPPVSGSPSVHISFLTLYHSQHSHCNPSCSPTLLCFSSLVCCGLFPPSDWRMASPGEAALCSGAGHIHSCKRSAATLLSRHVLSFWGGCMQRYHWEVFNWACAHCMPGALGSWAFKLHNFNWTLGISNLF